MEAAAAFQPLKIPSWRVTTERRPDGSILIDPQMDLGPYPPRLTDRLEYWASHAPDRIFLAQRNAERRWLAITYSDFRRQAHTLAQRLLNGRLSLQRPIAILSGNDIQHAILAMAAMYAGIPYAPVSPAYSLLSSDFTRLRHVFNLLTPGLVFASDRASFSCAIDSVVPPDATVVHDLSNIAGLAEGALPVVDPDCIAKILFTSGSTRVPKGVITTHRMLASNQEMLRTVFPFLGDEGLTLCDWLPWNHTFGGSHNFGLVLYNGGSMYIDAGQPMAGRFDETVANLGEIAPTVYFNVPKGYEMLLPHLRADSGLRERFFSRLRMMFYAAAGLSQHVWDELEQLALETRGVRIPMLTGLGATETAPFALCANAANTLAGAVGLPVPGVRLKLAPAGAKLEARVKGPNVTPGYWRQPQLTNAAFDEEGYYRLGDGLRFVDPGDANGGFLFDGRLSEDFKLSTGTWVSVGPLRTGFLLHFGPYVKDVVIAGHDRDEVTALIFPDPEYYARLEMNGAARDTFEYLLRTFAAQNSGSSTRIARAMILDEPPSLDAGELTDKGTVNQRATLERRSAAVERLYTPPYGSDVICHARTT